MKKNSFLIRFLIVLCGMGEIFAAVGLLAVLLLVPFSEALIESGRANVGLYAGHDGPDWSFRVRLPHSADAYIAYDNNDHRFTYSSLALSGLNPGFGRTSLGPFRLHIEKEAFSLNDATIKAQGFAIDHVDGIVTITRPEAAAQALAFTKWPLGVGMLCTGCVSLAILELLRRMLKSVEQREVFSAVNIRNVRKIGYLLIASSFMKLIAAGWLVNRMAAFVMQHVIAGNATLESSSEGDLSGVWTGLVVLVLAEVFRQGFRLKEDSQFTI